MRVFKIVFAGAVLLFLIGATANAQQTEMSDSKYMAQALSAAPRVSRKGLPSFAWGKMEACAPFAPGVTGLRA